MLKRRTYYIRIILFLSLLLADIAFAIEEHKHKIDSLSTLIENTIADSVKVKLYIGLSKEYQSLQKYSEARLPVERALKIKNLSNQEFGDLYMRLGALYNDESYRQKALENLEKSLTYRRLSGEAEKIANTYNLIGLIYMSMSDNENSISAFKNSYAIREAQGDTNGMIISRHNMAIIYYNKGLVTKSLRINNQIFKLEQALKDSMKMAITANNIGVIFLERDDFWKAEEYFLLSRHINKKNNKYIELANNYNNLGRLYHKKDENVKAIEFLDSSRNILTENKNLERLQENSYYLYLSYQALNNSDSALKYFVSYATVKDTLYQRSDREKIFSTSEKIANSKKEYERILWQQSVELENEKNRFDNIKLFIFGAAFLILSIVLFILFRNKVKTNKALRLSMQKVHAASQAKTMFLANMSHEIRTPMNGVIGMTEILQQTKLNKKQKEYTNIIAASANNLLTIINDILDFSKIEAGKVDLEKVYVNVHEIISDIGDLLSIKAKDKGIELIIFDDFTIRDTLFGDPIRLRQILINLANNAIKFTEKGHVLISVQKTEETEKYTFLTFSVKDSGIGISEENQKNLFNAFSQADTSTTRKYGGTGLGLSISGKLVQQMRGEIQIKSKENEGSEFFFTIPFEKTRAQISKLNIREMDLSSYKVLIIDDNHVNLKVFKEYMNFWKVDADIIDNPQQAINIALKAQDEGHPYQIYLIDYQMPKLSGVDVAKALQQQMKTDYYALLLSSVSTLLRMDKLNESGITAGLNKPVKITQLYEVLQKVIFNKNIQVFAQNDATSFLEIPQRKLHVLLVEDNVINQKVATVNIKRMGHYVDIANNGKIAVEMFGKKAYDLILMDIQMPVMNGYEATKEINKIQQKKSVEKQIPIIAMTAGALVSDREKAIESGMVDYLSKPFKQDELHKIIQKYVSQYTQK